MRAFLARLWDRLHRDRLDRELAEELRAHQAMLARDGLTPHQLGNITQLREATREEWSLPTLDALLQDLRVALRGLRRTPAFTIAAVITIALGIGATSSVFSMVYSVLLRPLPYPHPDRLVQLWTDHRVRSGRAQPEWLTPPEFSEWRAQSRTFESMASYQNWGPILTGAGEPETLTGLAVSSEFFHVLGVAPQHGRGFEAADDNDGAERVVVISAQLWHDRYGGDSSVVGREILLSGDPWRVIGIMPQSFKAPLAVQPALYRPVRRPATSGCGRGCIVLRAIGRLKPNTTLPQAQSDIAGIARNAATTFPASDSGITAWLIPLHTQIAGNTTEPLLALSGAVLCLLLIACVNVANLMLLRGAARQREFGVRAALGASRGRLVRQLLIESAALAGMGGVLGLAIGGAGAGLLGQVVPAAIRAVQPVTVDVAVVAFTALITLGAALIFGLAPAMSTTRKDLMQLLRVNTVGSGGRSGMSQKGLVTVQLALAVILVTGAGMMMHSLVELQRVDLGYRSSGVLLQPITLPATRYPADRVSTAIASIAERVRARPEIHTVEITDQPPLTVGDQDMTVLPLGGDAPGGAPMAVWYRVVSPGYMQLMHMHLVAGRYFDAGDRAGGAPVVIINEEAARRLWPGASPLGRQLVTGPEPDAVHYTVVGVVGSALQDGPTQPVKREVYAALGQVPTNGFTLMVEPSRDPDQAINAIRSALHEFDPLLPVSAPSEIQHVVQDLFATPRLYTIFLGVFAALALLLASVGVYGVMAFIASERQREIGVRLALGARPAQIRHALLAQGIRLAAIGLVSGLIISAIVARVVRSLFFHVAPVDIAAYAATIIVLGTAALVASWVPAWRAMRIDPVEAMRGE